MNLMFEPVRFQGKPLVWDYTIRNVGNYKGYYHWHQCCEVLFVHEGQGSIIVDQQRYEIRRGMLFLFQPFQLHKVFANVSEETPYVRTIFYFDPLLVEKQLSAFPRRLAQLKRLLRQREAPVYDRLASAEQLEWVYANYHQASLAGRGDYEEEVSLLVLQLLNVLQATDTRDATADEESDEQRAPLYAETVMQWIEAHYSEEIRLEQMAELLHLSKFYVSRLFHKETGSSITDYLAARRIKEACRLLQTTSFSVERVATEIGLPNVSHFIQLFKRLVGATPLQYRKLQYKTPHTDHEA